MEGILSDPYDLENKVVLVTGASQGLGKQFAELLCAKGARVALAARQVAKINQRVDIVLKSIYGWMLY